MYTESPLYDQYKDMFLIIVSRKSIYSAYIGAVASLRDERDQLQQKLAFNTPKFTSTKAPFLTVDVDVDNENSFRVYDV